ncbi:MAG: uracil-DNA glycosylase [Candidatus Cryptobacteroides sp.]
MEVKIEKSWNDALRSEFEKPYFASLVRFLHSEKDAGAVIYPPGSKIFKAFELTPVQNVKVVILGQDPYHQPGQAMGLSFSVPENVPAPPSLKNIFKEIESDLGVRMSGRPNLESWARQGVLLLNAILTVRAGQAASHSRIGWEEFTDAVIRYLNDNCDGIVFMLWGNFARSKSALIDTRRHYVLEAAHPSPLARGAFFGCRHFSKANEILVREGKTPINWQL